MINRKQQIAEVAQHLFGDKGFDQTPTLLIAKEAGVSEALIFKHFGSKEQLLDIIIRSGYKRIIEHNRGWMEERDPLAFIHSVIELPYKLVLEEPHFWKLQSRLADSVTAQKQHERFLQPVPARLTQAFTELGYTDPDKEARLLMLLVEALWKQQAKTNDENLRELLDFIKAKYGPQAR